MKRREFIVALGGAAVWPLVAHAQHSRVAKLGVLLVGNREPFSRLFLDGLRDLGYFEGKNIQIEYRSAAGNLNLLPTLAAELVGLRVDIIIASETPAVQAAKRATSEIPIVMAPSGDPVGTGLIVSLSRPGGNVTGLSAATAELAGKSLQLIREILPATSRIAALADPENAFTRSFLGQINAAAKGTDLEVETVMLRALEDHEPVFARLAVAGVNALVVQPTLPRAPIIALAQRYRLAAVSGNRAFADAGGLMSYAGSLADRYRNAAPYVDKILKGAKPADLPVQQPTKFELVINLRTAKALGISVPFAMLSRADEVIE
ncbi:MAG TPA: ABC transporter substrate-binding protein [Pseudolabrys sp.]|nr:ABC transporter substrate-binding protein [Pseudolabrys sp.]